MSTKCSAGEHATEVGLDVAHAHVAGAEAVARVVEDEKATLDEILAKRRGLLVRHDPVSRFRHVGHGILEQRGVIDCQHVRSVAVRVEHADLVRDREQILLGVRVAMRPRGEPAVVVAARRDGVVETREGEASVVWQIRRRRIALQRTEALCLADVRSRRDHENAEHQGTARRVMLLATTCRE